MLYIRKAIVIRKLENSVILLHKIKSFVTQNQVETFPHCCIDKCISTRRRVHAESNYVNYKTKAEIKHKC
jgi:hypothetical protein